MPDSRRSSGVKKISPGLRHQRAMRYMIKRFLADLYNAWRPMEGLEVMPPYHEAKLGMKHRPHHQDGAA